MRPGSHTTPEEPLPISDGYAAARAYKFYRQLANPRLARLVPESRVSARGVYAANKAAFDGVAAFFAKAGLDARKYIRFMAVDMNVRAADAGSKLASKWGLNMFAGRLAEEENRKKVYAWYRKSVDAVAEACLDSDCAGAADFLRRLIREGKLAAWVAGGRVSAYYLAAVPGFRKAAERLDPIGRAELAFISDRYDVYNTAANDATLAFERRKANPVKATDERVAELRAERAKRLAGFLEK